MTLPIIKLRDRTLSVAVFEFKNQDGSVNLSVNIQRSFKKKGESEYTVEEIHCYEDDLLKIANLCTRAYAQICNSRNGGAGVVNDKPAAAPAQTAAPAQSLVDDDIPFN